jgi:ubiquitin carboxyl-terminal hydrolase 5/13
MHIFTYCFIQCPQVDDPLLAQHLAHWGINMMSMQKTEKSMAELQIDLNVAFEFDKITEAGAKLRPLSGAGCVTDHQSII